MFVLLLHYIWKVTVFIFIIAEGHFTDYTRILLPHWGSEYRTKVCGIFYSPFPVKSVCSAVCVFVRKLVQTWSIINIIGCICSCCTCCCPAVCPAEGAVGWALHRNSTSLAWFFSCATEQRGETLAAQVFDRQVLSDAMKTVSHRHLLQFQTLLIRSFFKPL